jgi:hypothetical protein
MATTSAINSVEELKELIAQDNKIKVAGIFDLRYSANWPKLIFFDD